MNNEIHQGQLNPHRIPCIPDNHLYIKERNISTCNIRPTLIV